MRAIKWVIGFVAEVLKWMVAIATAGLWFGFFAYVGWFAARGMFPDLIPWLQGVMRK